MPDAVVYFDDGEALAVHRTCNKCYGHAVSVADLGTVAVVSPEGTAHAAGAEGRTSCGTEIGDGWWVNRQGEPVQ